MKDIQDGEMTSIQDGVTEDPEIPVFTGLSALCATTDIGTLERGHLLTSILTTMTDSEDFTCSISTVLGTAVT